MVSAHSAIQTGSFLGNYELLRRLATGGMADVFLARQRLGGRSERLVVLKSILPGLADRPEFVSMFLDEARIAAQLQHPNIVQIHDVSLLGERPCIAMEYLNGFDAAWVYRRSARDNRPLLPAETAALAAGAAYGLGYAHRKVALDGTPLRVVHRDVSPHNVFLTREGVVKILDFGIARTSQQIHTTQAGVLKGKIPYMSPEQMAGQPIDGRADLFGLGVVMWELATGARLFRRESEVLSMQAVLFDVIQAPSSARPDLPAELDRIIMRALDRDPDKRYATGEELAQDLERFISSTGAGPPHLVLTRLIDDLAEPGELDPLARRPPDTLVTPSVERIVTGQPFGAGASGTAVTLEGSGARQLSAVQARRSILWVVGVAAAAVLGALGWLALRDGGRPDDADRQGTRAVAGPERPATTEVAAPPRTAELPVPATPTDSGGANAPDPKKGRAGRRTARGDSTATTATTTEAAVPATPPLVPPTQPPVGAGEGPSEAATKVPSPQKVPSPPRREEPSGTGVSLDTDYQ